MKSEVRRGWKSDAGAVNRLPVRRAHVHRLPWEARVCQLDILKCNSETNFVFDIKSIEMKRKQ
jgi:hypothetical protein